MLDHEGAALARILGGDIRQELLGVGHRIGRRHPQGHAGDVGIIGQGDETRGVLGTGRPQRQTPRFNDGQGFNSAHGRTSVFLPPPFEGSDGSRRGTKTGSLVIQTPRGIFPLVRIGCWLSNTIRSGFVLLGGGGGGCLVVVGRKN